MSPNKVKGGTPSKSLLGFSQKMLRQKLDVLAQEEDIDTHERFLCEISAEIENTIEILESEDDISIYTCIVHIFNFVEDEYYKSIVNYFPLGRVFASPEFVEYLLRNNYLDEIELNNVIENNLIIYFENDCVKHGGKITVNNSVISKWGLGHLYRHSIFEVPASYGESVRYFRNICYDEAMDYFVEFAREHGLVLQGE